MFGTITEILISVLVMLYAPYKSFKAMKNPAEQHNMLAWWIVYSVFELTEVFTDFLLAWFPFYYEIKLLIIVYLLFFGGAGLTYRILEPMVSKYEGSIDQTLAHLPAEARKTANQVGNSKFMQDAANDSAGFIKKYGDSAFATVMQAYTQQAQQQSKAR